MMMVALLYPRLFIQHPFMIDGIEGRILGGDPNVSYGQEPT